MHDWATLGQRYSLQPDVILTPDGAKSNCVLTVDRGVIASISENGASPGNEANDVIPLNGRAIIPGFVDAHTHLGHTFGKSLTFGEPSQIWQRIWIPLEANLDVDLNYASAKWMFWEALRGGFTTIVNFAIANEQKIEAIHQAARETGIRLVSTTGAVDRADYPSVPSHTPKFHTVDEAIGRFERHVDHCRGEQRITPSLCVSGPQVASQELIRATCDFCNDKQIPFQIHSSEHHPEVHACILLYGKRPIEYISDGGGLSPNTLVHHGVLLTEIEIELLRASGAAVSYNPVASQWKNDGIAPALAFLARGIRFGLGTDSTRSDAFRLLEAAENCQRLASQRVMDFSCGAGMAWVDAATRGGADAAGLRGVTGAIAPGLRADFLVLDISGPEVSPSWDFEWELVRYYNRSEIRAVIIDGRVVMVDGKPTDWDAEAFRAQFIKPAMEVARSAGMVLHHPTTGESRNTNHRGKP